MQYQPNMRQIARLISRRMQLAFIAGLLIGIIIGWLLSPLVGWVVRIGFVALLLVPLALAIMFWWRVRKATSEGSATIVTWRGGNLPPSDRDPFGFQRQQQSRDEHDIIDVEEIDRGNRQ